MKILTLIISLMLMSSMAEANQFNFDFKKSSLFNKYDLVIFNQDAKRTISFSGCFPEMPTETDYYVLMKNGSKYYIDSKLFCGIGMKGRYWVNAGERGKIPFKIKKEIMQNAQSIVFKGVSFLPVRSENFVDFSDMRELFVTYDVKSGKASFEVSEKVLPKPTFSGDLIDLK